MSRSVSADEVRALLLAHTLRGVPERLARVQIALKPVAQAKALGVSPKERLTVAQACTELQFAIADIESIVTFVAGSLQPSSIAEKAMVKRGHSQGAGDLKKGSNLH